MRLWCTNYLAYKGIFIGEETIRREQQRSIHNRRQKLTKRRATGSLDPCSSERLIEQLAVITHLTVD